jgi:hypothetical protein
VTYPYSPQPGPRPGPPAGGFRPGAPPPTPDVEPSDVEPSDVEPSDVEPSDGPGTSGSTGHPAVDAVLRSLANAAPLAPADQIAEYEAAHRVLQETLTSIDG